MNDPRNAIRQMAADLGFYRVGFADCLPVDDNAVASYTAWIEAGRNAGMDYLAKYPDVRSDPRLLLDGARSIIVCAASYYTPSPDPANPINSIAMYARGDDYHETLRQRLSDLASFITDTHNAQCRICIDTAPLRERYWAVRAGLGFIGLNNQLIIPGAGSYFFIASIITTARFTPDEPNTGHCLRCGRCISACPGRALEKGTAVDASKCLSYLTIEHRGDLPHGTTLNGHLYGCDICQAVCPHNANPPITPIEQFLPRASYSALTPEFAAEMTQQQFSLIFRHSPIKRTKLAGLRRNALAILSSR